MERAICTKVFRTKYLKRERSEIFMLSSQVFSSRSFTWVVLYLRAALWCFRLCLRVFNVFLFYNKRQAFGWQNSDRNWICSSYTNKKSAILFLSKHSASNNFLTRSEGYWKRYFEFSFGININFIYSNSP